MAITIVGLGAGDGRLLTREAWEILSTAEQVLVRTARHPAVADLPASVQIDSFDRLYETAEDFAEVYSQIVAQVLAAGRQGAVIYAVPGHPFVGETTVPAIVQQAETEGLAVRIIAGLSFVEPMLTAVRLDGMDGVQVHDALDIVAHDYPQLNADQPTLIGQVYNTAVASELKLALNMIFPDEHEVVLVHGAGTPDEQIKPMPLYAIDRDPAVSHLTSLYLPPLPRRSDVTALAEAVATLRGPGGCPWDQKQTPQSLRPSLLEETAEVLDALDRDAPDDLREELGDLLLNILMQTQMATEEGFFTLADVVGDIYAKIVRRHPHVWGDAEAEGAEAVLATWAEIKASEKSDTAREPSVLDNIPLALSALAFSQKLQKRVRRVGFDWSEIDGVYAKLQEEVAEVQTAVSAAERQAEVGDVLFITVNLAHWLGVDAEVALREANLRFARRFHLVEQLARERGLVLEELDEPALTRLWDAAKQRLTAVEKSA